MVETRKQSMRKLCAVFIIMGIIVRINLMSAFKDARIFVLKKKALLVAFCLFKFLNFFNLKMLFALFI